VKHSKRWMSSTSICIAVFFVWCEQTLAQNFVYVEPNNPSCPTLGSPTASIPKAIKLNAAGMGDIRVSCGFTEGSYTVTLSATDPNATFSPKTFLVNFGSMAGSGRFSVKFTTLGEQTISATITSNMGSPVLMGKFASANNVVNVVAP
jgi:hypothetical protein